MNFLDLQNDLYDITGDFDSKWIVGGTSLKRAIIHGIKQVNDRLAQNALYLEQNHKKIELQVNNQIAVLPADFYTEYGLYEFEDSDISDILSEYRVNKQTKQIEFNNDQDNIKNVFLKYMPVETVLVDNTDEPLLEEHFRDTISLYAMEKYHLAQKDIGNAGQSVMYAEEKMRDLINKYF